MPKRIEHHQTFVITHFRIIDGEQSYDPPSPIQQVCYVLSETEFCMALERIKEYMEQLQQQLEGEDAERDSGD